MDVQTTPLRPGGSRRLGVLAGLLVIALAVAVTKPWSASSPPVRASPSAATLAGATVPPPAGATGLAALRTLIVTAPCADGRIWVVARVGAVLLVPGGNLGSFGAALRCADGTLPGPLMWSTVAGEGQP